MAKKNNHVAVKKNGSRITLEFDAMFYVKASRRSTPPPTRVEMPRKGKGSYNRKEKHRGGFHYDIDGISPYIYNNINSFLEDFDK